jgi:hypothetical protein
VHTPRRHLVRFPIGWKFLVVLATVVPSMLAISGVAAESLSNVKQELDRVYEDNLASTRLVGEVAEGMREAEVVVQRLVTERHADVRYGLLVDLRDRVVPRVEALLFDLRSLSEDDAEDLGLEAELERTWRAFIAYATSPEFLTLESPLDRDLASEHIGRLGESVTRRPSPSISPRSGRRETRKRRPSAPTRGPSSCSGPLRSSAYSPPSRRLCG